MDFEKKLKRLDEIVIKMEKGDLPLEDSLKLFEEGVKLSRECHTRLNEAEAQVKVLMDFDEKGQMMTKDFVSEES